VGERRPTIDKGGGWLQSHLILSQCGITGKKAQISRNERPYLVTGPPYLVKGEGCPPSTSSLEMGNCRADNEERPRMG